MYLAVNSFKPAAPIGTGGPASQERLTARAKDAAGVLATYMHQNGVDTMTPNQLAKLARNASGDTSPEVSEAAEFMLSNPDIYAQLETRDVAGRDGISGVSNFDFAAREGFQSDAPDSTQSSMTEQAAESALANHMEQTGAKALDADALYQLAMRPGADVSPETSAAAKFMLKHTDVFKANETHDVTGTDGPSGTGNTKATTRGEAPGLHGAGATEAKKGVADVLMRLLQALTPPAPAQQAKPMDGQSAAGVLAEHMAKQPQGQLMTPDKLYELSTSKDVPPKVAEAAKFMLNNPQVFKAIETHDVMGADGKSGIGNFRAAARGEVRGVNGAGASEAKNGVTDLLRQVLQALSMQQMLQALQSSAPKQKNGLADFMQLLLQALTSSVPKQQAKQQAKPMDGRSAAGALAEHMAKQSQGQLMTPDKLYGLSISKYVPPKVAEAAKFMLNNPLVFKAIETHDVAGADGKSGIGNFQAAARGEVPGVKGAEAGEANSGVADILKQLLQALTTSALAQQAKPVDGVKHGVADLLGQMLQAITMQQLLQALTPPAPAQQAKPMDGRSAAGVLADHMSKQPQGQLMTPDKLYELSTSKDVSPTVAEAAKFMLDNPQVFKAIETHDVVGADGKSGIGNFQAAARGEVRGVKGAGAGEAKNDVTDLLRQVLQALTMQHLLQALMSSARKHNGIADFMQLLLQGLAASAPAQQAKPMDGRSAAGALADHMSKQPQGQLMTPDKLYELSTSKDVPPKVAEAAKFMLNNPQVFKAIETHDVAGADGKSGIGNFQAAARGEVPGVKGAEAGEAKNDVADLLREMLQAITMQQLLQALQSSAPRSRLGQ